MTKDKLISIAERNFKKAKIAYEHNYNRTGVTEQEKENLKNNMEYNQIVLDLIKEKTSKYQKLKDKARNEAAVWQNDFENHSYSYGELTYYQNHFEKLAKRYGLVREFKENGII